MFQKANFTFEILIHDDASTDKTATIIREYENKYPDIIKPIYQSENQYSKGVRVSSVYQFPRAKGKYITMCEGDDYWTDPLKLQKQVDFLEANEDYGLVHTDLDQYDTVRDIWIRGLWKNSKKNKISGDIYDLLMISNDFGIYLCTMCFRSHFVIRNKEYDEVMAQNFMYGDVPLYLHIARQSKIGYIPISTAVRNVLSYSATQGRDFQYMINFTRTALLIFQYFNNLKPVKTDLENIYRKHKQNELDVHFSFQRGEKFKELYNLLEKSDINYRVYIQRIGINSKFNHLCSRVILKTISFLKIDKILE